MEDKSDLRLLNEKPYMIRLSGRGAVVNIPSSFLSLTGMKLGDRVYLYMQGEDLLVSKKSDLIDLTKD